MAISDFRFLAIASLAALTIAGTPAHSADEAYYPITAARVDLSLKLGKLTPDYREGSGRASSFIGEFSKRHLTPLDRPQSVTFPPEYFEDTLVIMGVVPPQNMIGKAASPVCSFRGRTVLSKGVIKDGNYVEDNGPISTEGRTPCSAWLKARGMEMMQPSAAGETPPNNQ